ncbi:hypothetical protein TUM4438_19210 [Shewanella sairae]|uniref:DUF3465 domain-containing protein n=1 Tax=Shewanella sairae TaxID=190310 RepID=A0ABQ4PDR8_9GAMM|nr:hypothetical protein TUM4438_19210 [Shewanella sairae]
MDENPTPPEVASSHRKVIQGVLMRIVIMLIALAIASFVYNRAVAATEHTAMAAAAGVMASDEIGAGKIKQAFEQQSNLQIQAAGTVTRVLADDNKGSRHQRFILTLANGQTVLVAHNIDLAQRIAGLQEGDEVEFYGEYEWNKWGGVIHWTHHDPRGKHIGGWLKHQGKTYQ